MSTTDKNILPTRSLNYKSYSMQSSSLKYLKIPLFNRPQGSVTLSASSSEEIQFKIPGMNAFNLSKSILAYSTVIPAQGAGTAIWAHSNSGLEAFQSLNYTTAQGQSLANIQYLNNMLSVCRPLLTSDEDYENTDVSQGMNPVMDRTTNYTGISTTLPTGNQYELAGAQLTALTSGQPKFLRRSLALDAPLTVSRSFMLGNIVGSIFQPDKVSYFGVETTLSLLTAPSTKFAFTSSSINDPTAGVLPLANQPTLECSLYLAVEQNPIIVASLQEKLNQGKLTYLVPYVRVVRNTTSGAGTGQSLNVSISSESGRVLKRVIHSVFPLSEVNNVAFDHSNINGSKITRYSTYVDSLPVQNTSLSCLLPSDANPTGLEDFRENQRFLKGSVVADSLAYQQMWAHTDQFAEIVRNPEIPDSNVLSGRDTLGTVNWGITMDLTGSFSHYTIMHFVRELTCDPNAGPMYIN